MSPPDNLTTSLSLHTALPRTMVNDATLAPLIRVLAQLTVEVEALREALSSPDTPESVRQSYRQAYERIAVLSHNSAGPGGGLEKVLSRFFPTTRSDAEYATERMMMKRLGATEEEIEKLCEEMDTVSMYT